MIIRAFSSLKIFHWIIFGILNSLVKKLVSIETQVYVYLTYLNTVLSF